MGPAVQSVSQMAVMEALIATTHKLTAITAPFRYRRTSYDELTRAALCGDLSCGLFAASSSGVEVRLLQIYRADN